MIPAGPVPSAFRQRDRAWRLLRTFTASAIREGGAPVAMVAPLLQFDAPEPDRLAVQRVLGELVSNAIDFGLLGLDSRLRATAEGYVAYFLERTARLDQLVHGAVSVTLENRPGAGVLRLRVSDPGPGFDAASALVRAPCPDAPFGRGIARVRATCQRVAYGGRGNIVVAEYAWGSAA